MKKYIIAAGLACGFIGSVLTQTAAAEVPLTVNAGYGYWYWDSDRDLSNSGVPLVGLEWAVSDRLAAELTYGYSETDTDKAGEDVDINYYSAGLLFYSGSYIGGPNRIRPYLGFGLGQTKFDSDANNNTFHNRESDVHVSGGLRWMITPAFGARLEARAVNSLDKHDWDTLLSVGLNYYFGKTAEDTGASALAGGAVASGDEDGDGVSDANDKCPGTPPGTRVDSDGCPLPVARVASIRLLVNFAFDSSKVQEKYFKDISEVAAFLKRFEDVHVVIEGHTDSTGPDDYNMKLSQRRAEAVVDVLVNDYGIARNRLEPKGYGEADPVASNDTAEGRAQNRRVMATLQVEYEE